MSKFGLFSHDGKPVPLKGVSVDLFISGFVANVTSVLNYSNTEDVPVEVKYTFPVDDSSAVYRFEALIEGRRIVAECQEKEEAKQTYDDAIASGQTAMLLEEDESSGDIFCCTLGNLPPKTDAELTLAYVIELPLEPDGKLNFTLPTVLNPRYSPDVGGVTAAKGASYDSAQEVAKHYTFQFKASVTGNQRIMGVQSTKDKLDVSLSDDKMVAEVSLAEEFNFDHDFGLLVEYEDCYQPQVIVEAGDPNSSGLLKEDLLMVNFFPQLESTEQNRTGEFIFIIDRSGSMGFGSNKMSNAKEALMLFLKSLPVGCFFNIVSFGRSYSCLFDGGSKEYTEANLEKAGKLLSGMGADMGGTEILEPLKHVYSHEPIKGQPRQLFLLTDGEVGNVTDVIAIAKKHCQNTRVFTVGIGSGASTSLVKGVARAGKGKEEFIADSERIQPKVMALLKCAMQSSVNDLAIDWTLPRGMTAHSVPESPTTIFSGERLILFALLKGTAQGNTGEVVVRGKVNDKPLESHMVFTLDSTKATDSKASLHRLAAKAEIKRLQDEMEFGSMEDPKKEDIILLSKSVNIVSKYTSFVAVDSESKEKLKEEHVVRHVPVVMSARPIVMNCCMAMPAMAAPQTFYRSAAPVKMKKGGAGLRFLSISNPFSGVFGSKKKSKGSTNPSYSVACGAAPPPAPKSRGGSRARKSAPLQVAQDMDLDPVRGCDLDSDDYENEELEEKVFKGDKMMQMVGLQRFAGNWSLDQSFASLVGVSLDDLRKSGITKDDSVLATLCAMVWFETLFPERKDEWQMIVDKAANWVRTKDLEGKAVVYLLSKVAEKFIDDFKKSA